MADPAAADAGAAVPDAATDAAPAAAVAEPVLGVNEKTEFIRIWGPHAASTTPISKQTWQRITQDYNTWAAANNHPSQEWVKLQRLALNLKGTYYKNRRNNSSKRITWRYYEVIHAHLKDTTSSTGIPNAVDTAAPSTSSVARASSIAPAPGQRTNKRQAADAAPGADRAAPAGAGAGAGAANSAEEKPHRKKAKKLRVSFEDQMLKMIEGSSAAQANMLAVLSSFCAAAAPAMAPAAPGGPAAGPSAAPHASAGADAA